MGKRAQLPAGPKLPVPVQTMGWIQRPVPFLERCHRRYGDVFTIHIGGEGPWVVLAHPDAVREVFKGDPSLLLAGEGNEILGPVLGSNSVLLLDGARHLRQRKLLLPPFHGERIKRYGGLIEEIATEEVARWPRREPFELAPRMAAITLEVILRAVFGIAEGARKEELREALRRLIDFVAAPSRLAALALLGPKVGPRVAGVSRAVREVDRLLLAEVAQRRTATDLADRDDVLSLLLQARHEDGEPMSDAELRDELLTLLVAGHETTATGLSWAFERLMRHPEKLARVASGDQPYLRAVGQEILRLRPIIPVVARRLAEPMTLAGHDLPAGVKVTPCIVLVHRRADVYGPDPLAFRPERFLEKPPGTYTWFPFGGGVRRCLGAAFAQYEMETVLHVVARDAALRPADARGGERVARRAITLVPDAGARAVLDA